MIPRLGPPTRGPEQFPAREGPRLHRRQADVPAQEVHRQHGRGDECGYGVRRALGAGATVQLYVLNIQGTSCFDDKVGLMWLV